MKQNPKFEEDNFAIDIPGFVSITYPGTVACQKPKYQFQDFDISPIFPLESASVCTFVCLCVRVSVSVFVCVCV
jgi:hypothetical protein